MTELETQLLKSFKTLSEQYERERTQQAEQFEALRQQVQGLTKQVASLQGQVNQWGPYFQKVAPIFEDLNGRLLRLADESK